MTYERYYEAVDYLQRRLWHELPIVPIERALQHRVRTVLAYLGDPHTKFPVIHAGGSAGKGSTSTITASILQAAGLRTGLYTSPHLQTFIERVAVDGVLIPPDAFAELVLGLDPLVRKMHLDVLDGVGYGRPALVEVAFAAGMAHLARERCDVAVVEVGLGGRTDCTNVFDEKPVTVLTNIAYEHRERLGWSLASIAREKSALIRGGEIVLTAAGGEEALPVIEARARETGACLLRAGRDLRSRITAADRDGSSFDFTSPFGSFRALRLPLAGAHQVTNATLAIGAVLAFARRTGSELNETHIREGLAAVRISGRLELVQASPVVLLDCAHNPVEARNLTRALRTHWLPGGARLHLVCGILADKDQVAMVRALAPIADSVVVTQPPLAERVGDPDRMLALFRAALGDAHVAFEPSPARALDRALAAATKHDVVCVTGSMFLVGALRERWLPEQRILDRRTAVL